jgi:hypothetical protein
MLKIKEIMHRYYDDQLAGIEDRPLIRVHAAFRPEKPLFFLFRNWEGVFGILFIAFSILHYCLTGRLFAVERLMMAFSVVF